MLVYSNTFQADFTLDDVPIIRDNRQITTLKNLPRLFQMDYWGGASESFGDKGSLYRPLTVASYALNYAVHGVRPGGYHFVNVVLHALATALLVVLVFEVFKEMRVAFVAGLLFAVHPIHTEAVSGVVGRAELMALLGTLACCWGYERARLAAFAGKGVMWGWMAFAVAAYLAGMFSKETGVVAPALILLWELLLPTRRWLLKGDRKAVALGICLALAFGLYMFMRSEIVRVRNIHEGFAGVGPGERILTALRVCLEYVGLLLAPARLSADYWKTDVPLARSVFDPGVAAAVLVLLGAGGLALWAWRRRPAVAWGLGFFAAGLFPVSNLPFAIGVMKAERILYTPSAGFLVALAALHPLVSKHAQLKTVSWVLVWAVTGLYAARTWVRNEDWRDNRTLAMATLQRSPSSPVFNTILSRWYRDRNENARAREHLLKALEQQPNEPGTLFNLGNIDLDEKRYGRAIEYYLRALKLSTNHVQAMNNLGMAYYETGRFLEAAPLFDHVRSLRPGDPAAYLNLVSAYVQVTNLNAALPIAEEARRRFPHNAGVLWNVAAVYQMLGRTNEAAAAFSQATQLDPKIRTTPNLKGNLQ